MNYDFRLFPHTFEGWVYFLLALIIVALIIFIGRHVKRSQKVQPVKSSSNFKSKREVPASIPRVKVQEKKKMQAQIKSHMTPENTMKAIVVAIYIVCIVLMVFAPVIAQMSVIFFGLVFPLLIAIVVFIYAPSEKLKTSLYAFAICEAVVLALVVTGYGEKIVAGFVSLAGIIQCVASLFVVGLPLYGLYNFAKRKGWTKQAEEAADSTVKSFFEQFKEQPPE